FRQMASVTFGEETGWRSIVLESDELRVVVLPDKGAEVHKLVHRESDVDVLFHGPWGLRPPGAPPLEGSGDDEFMWNYAGGWQELFPSVNESCTYAGRSEEHTSELQSRGHLVCRLLLEKKKANAVPALQA